MPDMYDKLGDLLNNVLESGKIPNFENENKHLDYSEKEITSENPDFFYSNEKKTQKNTKINQNTIRKIINDKNQSKIGKIETDINYSKIKFKKLHKYTDNMQFPKEVSKSLDTLHIVSFTSWNDVKKKYHNLLKEYHPDIKNSYEKTQENAVKDIINAYKILEKYFNNKS